MRKGNQNLSFVAEPVHPENGHTPLSTAESVALLEDVKREALLHDKSITSGTVKQYGIKWRSILKRIGGEIDEDGANLVSFFKRASSSYSKASFKLYKCAALYHLQEYRMAEIYSAVKSVFSKNPKHLPVATSKSKRKNIGFKEFKQLVGAFKALPQSDLVRFTIHFMSAALCTGLRPSEWRNANLERFDGYAILTVQNAKNSNGRATGASRSLRIEGAHWINETEQLINLVRPMSDEKFDNTMKSVSTKIADISTRCLSYKLKVSSYTFRHQWAANSKILFAREKVALGAGHNTIDTASTHYGRRRNAWSLEQILSFTDSKPFITDMPSNTMENHNG